MNLWCVHYHPVYILVGKVFSLPPVYVNAYDVITFTNSTLHESSLRVRFVFLDLNVYVKEHSNQGKVIS